MGLKDFWIKYISMKHNVNLWFGPCSGLSIMKTPLDVLLLFFCSLHFILDSPSMWIHGFWCWTQITETCWRAVTTGCMCLEGWCHTVTKRGCFIPHSLPWILISGPQLPDKWPVFCGIQLWHYKVDSLFFIFFYRNTSKGFTTDDGWDGRRFFEMFKNYLSFFIFLHFAGGVPNKHCGFTGRSISNYLDTTRQCWDIRGHIRPEKQIEFRKTQTNTIGKHNKYSDGQYYWI